ncbi:MAG: LacI family DNA-binding transcriptional regulator [Capsulimonadaceae bacterium]
MEKKQVSIADVARVAGVAPSTVSKTLNRTSQRRRPTEVQLRIRRVALEMGYHPSHTARSLSTGHTDIIGMYWGYDYNVLDPFFGQVLNGVRTGCRNHLKNLLMHGTFHKHPLNNLYEELTDGKTDGLVIYPMGGHESVLEMLADSSLPVVSISIPLPGLPVVRADWEGGTRMAVERLAALGHKYILYRNVMRDESEHTRFSVFQAAAQAYGIRFMESNVADWVGNISVQEAALLSQPAHQRPTAALCFNDTFAYRLLAYCWRIGMKAPDDLAVVGFDGAYPWYAQSQVLTTLDARWDLVAQTAVDLVVDWINNRPVPLETILPVSWRQGETA